MIITHIRSHSFVLAASLALCAGDSAAGHYNAPEDFIAPRRLSERLAVNQRTLAITGERTPNSALCTYLRPSAHAYLNHLLRLTPGIVQGGSTVWSRAALQVTTEDTPGSVVATFILGGVTTTTEFLPLLVESSVAQWDGAALYKISTQPPTPACVRVSAGNGVFFAHTAWPQVLDDAPPAPLAGLTLARNVAACSSSNQHAFVRITGSAPLSTNARGVVRATFAQGAGDVMMSFAASAARADELIAMDSTTAQQQHAAHYAALLRSTLDTPVASLNQAFRAAIYNLEYAWLPPFGWIECPHHWPALWHMQVTAGAEWLGQADRSRLCTKTHAETPLPGGAAPQFNIDGTVRDDFGGSSHFWAWQLRHYLDYTGDTNFALQCLAAFDRNHAFIQRDRDRDANLLPHWKQQIGNQEDFIATPYDGATPGIEAINIWRTRALLADLAGDTNTASRCRASAAAARQSLKDSLWLPDLGRFAFYCDPLGTVFLEGQYHTYTYPTIWGIVDDFDSYTNLRHLRDRLTGVSGEVYCANLFPTHQNGTWGSQAGAAQQPWAAWALAAQGLNNETYRPLQAVADWVMDHNHRGAWPEVSTESINAYFTPPAGLFIAAVAEALFGLHVDRVNGVLTLAPSFPDAWPRAALHLPEYAAEYTHSNTTFTYRLRCAQPIAYRLAWRFAPTKITRVLVNGAPAPFSVTPQVGGVMLHAAIPAAAQIAVTVTTEPVPHAAVFPRSIAEGDRITVQVPGARITAVDDRCGVLQHNAIESDGALRATLKTGVLTPYRRFGTLGQLNFAKRTFFVACLGDAGVRFWLPIDLLVLPPVEVAAATVTNDILCRLSLTVRNNTSATLDDTLWLTFAGQSLAVPVTLAPRSECALGVPLPPTFAAQLAPGDNRMRMLVPRHGAVEFAVTLAATNLATVRQIALPPEAFIADSAWATLRGQHTHQAVFHLASYFQNCFPLHGLAGVTNVTLPGLPDLPVAIRERTFIPLSGALGKPAFQLPLPPGRYKKLYLLVLPLLDYHDMFSDVATITLRDAEDKIVCAKTLALPGDLDWWWPPSMPFTHFATAQQSRTTRRGLLPLRTAADADWPEALPPHFPNYDQWTDTRALVMPNCVLNLVEISVPRPGPLKSLTVQTRGAEPALGILAVVADMAP
jgi:hypothetical protein